jgi:hypothetical protein
MDRFEASGCLRKFMLVMTYAVAKGSKRLELPRALVYLLTVGLEWIDRLRGVNLRSCIRRQTQVAKMDVC